MTTSKSIWDIKDWQGKIINHCQAGGIEISILDNGAGRGVRIAWFNTGSGLFFKVVLDRGMDISEAFYNQYGLSWISHLGVVPSTFSVQSGTEWLNYFGGGLLTTCGLTHIGGPEEDESGIRGLHDRISLIPGTIESIIQPDLLKDKLEMSITGRIMQSSVFGPHLELKRTISATLGQSKIRIHDEVTNLGNREAPHMLLYHINFGFPLIDEDTRLIWSGKCIPRDNNDPIFNNQADYKICKLPMDEHAGSGESVAFIDINSDENGICICEVYNARLSLRVLIRFRKAQLPWLTNWQHWGKYEYVTALEPGTNPPIGQRKARDEGSLIILRSGETRNYDIEIEIKR